MNKTKKFIDEDQEINNLTDSADVWQYLHDLGSEVMKIKNKVDKIEKEKD